MAPDAKKIEAAFTRLGELALKDSRIVDIAVYAGHTVTVAFDLRFPTKDVAAVFEKDRAYIKNAVQVVALEMDLPPDWLNDAARSFAGPEEAGNRLRFGSFSSQTHPGLRVFVSSPTYLFAMKLVDSQGAENSKDIEDIKNLSIACGITNAREAMNLVQSFFPDETMQARINLVLEKIFAPLNIKTHIKVGLRPRSLMEVVTYVNAQSDAFGRAVAEFLDETKKMNTAELFKSLADPGFLQPHNPGFGHWQDAYLAATAEHLCRDANIPIPEWTEQPERFLSCAWFDNSGLKSLNAVMVAESPLAFRRRFIFTEAKPLRRA